VWWNEAKNGWYLTVRDPSRPQGQRQDRLAKGWEGHDEAIQSWHESEANRASEAAVHRFGEDMKVGDLCNLFLANLEPKLSPKRFRITKGYLTDLTVSLGAETIGELRIGGVARIEKWMAAHTGWNSTSTSRSVVSRVKQLFKWGADQGFIISSPVGALKRGSDEVRVAIFSAKQVAAILKEANPAFATVFKILLLTGCRPDELCRVTAHDLEEDGGLHLLVDHKNQKSKTYRGSKRRIYLLFKELKEILRKAAKSHPNGALFRTPTGKAWTITTICNAFRDAASSRRCRRLGLNDHVQLKRTDGTKVRKYKYVPYVCRHTFAFRLLSGFYRDADGMRIKKNYGEVGVYLGDSARMVEEVYGKLVKATEMLSEEIG
jgi:integrase